MKYINLDEFEKIDIDVLLDYKLSKIQEAKKLAAEVNIFWPCEILFRVSMQDGKNYFEQAEIKLQHEKLFIAISYYEYSKRFSLSCYSTRDLRHVDNYSSQVNKLYTQPNKIGKLSTKKIKEWIEYFENVYSYLAKQNEINFKMKNEFLQAIAPLPVEWRDKNKSGWINLNGLQLEFTIENSYIRQDIKVCRYIDHSLANFIKLSKNRYSQSTKK